MRALEDAARACLQGIKEAQGDVTAQSDARRLWLLLNAIEDQLTAAGCPPKDAFECPCCGEISLSTRHPAATPAEYDCEECGHYEVQW